MFFLTEKKLNSKGEKIKKNIQLIKTFRKVVNLKNMILKSKNIRIFVFLTKFLHEFLFFLILEFLGF